MKTKKRQTKVYLLTLFAFLTSLATNAKVVEIEGIAYDLASNTYTAEVTKASKLYVGDIVIPDTVIYKEEIYKVTSIGRSAFFGCTKLNSITIPESVTNIGGSVFFGCDNLTSITIPESVTRIGDHAFYDCSSLTTITIPESVTSIGANPVMSCKLDTIVVADGNTVYDSRNGCNAIIETATNTLIAGCVTTTIPENVTSIGDNAFYGYTNLTSITIPEGVASIGEWSFFNCGLVSVILPASLASIGSNCFSNCNNLTTITIPEGVTSIGDYAFYNCSSLISASLPKSLTEIGESAFSGCTKIQDIYCHAENVPMYPTELGPALKEATLHVPASALEAYKSTYPWSNFGNIVAIDDEDTKLLVTEGKQWAVERYTMAGVQGVYSYCLQGDTIINGKEYKIEYEGNGKDLSDMKPSGRYMREENGRVYSYAHTERYKDEDEVLFFDFNLEEGDTIVYVPDAYSLHVMDVYEAVVPHSDGQSRKCYEVELWNIREGEVYESGDFGGTFTEGIGNLFSGLSNPGFGLVGSNQRLLYVKQGDTMLYQREEEDSDPSRPITKRGYGLYHGDSYLYAYNIDESKEVTDSTDFARWNDKTVIFFDVDTIGPNAFSGATFRQGQVLYFTERLNTIFKDAFTDINIVPRTSQEALMSDDLTLVFAGANPPSIDKSHIMDYADSTYRINYVVPDLATYIASDIQWAYTSLITIDDFIRGYISPENEVTVNDSTEMDVEINEDNTTMDGNVDLVVNARPRKDIPVRIGEGENKDIYSRAPAWMRYTVELKITDTDGTVLYTDSQQCSAYGECEFKATFARPANGIVLVYSRSIDQFGRATEWAVSAVNLDTSIDTMIAPDRADIYYDLHGRPVAHPTRGIYIRNGKKVVM